MVELARSSSITMHTVSVHERATAGTSATSISTGDSMLVRLRRGGRDS